MFRGGNLMAKEDLSAELACRDLLARYASGADWIDEPMFAGVFWDDAKIDFGSFQTDKPTYVALIMGYRNSYSRRWHHFGLPRVAVSGERALIEATCLAHLRPAHSNGCDEIYHGRYLFELERRGGEWRITVLTYMMSLSQSLPQREVEPALRKAETLDPSHPLFALHGGPD
jgi:hypothetical protein